MHLAADCIWSIKMYGRARSKTVAGEKACEIAALHEQDLAAQCIQRFFRKYRYTISKHTLSTHCCTIPTRILNAEIEKLMTFSIISFLLFVYTVPLIMILTGLGSICPSLALLSQIQSESKKCTLCLKRKLQVL